MSNKIGKRIRNIREQNNLSQNRFGTKVGLSGKTISSYENGRSVPPMKILEKITEIYGTSFLSISRQNRKKLKLRITVLEKQVFKIKELLNDDVLSF